MNLETDVLVAGYDQTVTSLLEVTSKLTDEEWVRPTDVPGWSVGDHVAHVAGVELEILGEPVDPEVADPGAHVSTEVGAHMERAVAARRGRPQVDVIGELLVAFARRQKVLHQERPADDELVLSVMGHQRPFHTMLGQRVFDIWIHEQDVRRAVGEPMQLNGPAADVAFGGVLDAVPHILRRAWTAPGQRVRIVCDGIANEFRAEESGEIAKVHVQGPVGPQPDLTVITSWPDLGLVVMGRKPAADADIEILGDLALGQRVVDHLKIAP